MQNASFLMWCLCYLKTSYLILPCWFCLSHLPNRHIAPSVQILRRGIGWVFFNTEWNQKYTSNPGFRGQSLQRSRPEPKGREGASRRKWMTSSHGKHFPVPEIIPACGILLSLPWEFRAAALLQPRPAGTLSLPPFLLPAPSPHN